eukprot:127207-Rhodomonas_salina.1
MVVGVRERRAMRDAGQRGGTTEEEDRRDSGTCVRNAETALRRREPVAGHWWLDEGQAIIKGRGGGGVWEREMGGRMAALREQLRD